MSIDINTARVIASVAVCAFSGYYTYITKGAGGLIFAGIAILIIWISTFDD